MDGAVGWVGVGLRGKHKANSGSGKEEAEMGGCRGVRGEGTAVVTRRGLGQWLQDGWTVREVKEGREEREREREEVRKNMR